MPAPSRQAQVLALLVRVPFLMTAQYQKGNNFHSAALKNKAIASGLSLLSDFLDIYHNGKTDRCLYTYPWAAYDLYEMANALYEIMYAPEEIKVNDEGFDDPEMIIDQPEVQKLSKIVYGLILLETYFAILPAGYNGTKEERANGQASALREIFRGFQSLSRCGTEFFSGDKKSHKSILLAIAALASTYGIGKDFLKLADVLEKNKRSNNYRYNEYRYAYENDDAYGNAGGSYGSSGTYGNTPLDPSPAAVRRKYLEVLGLQDDASDAEITRAYRNLAKQYHPDKNPGDLEAERRFKEISEANTALTKDKTVEQKI